METFYCGGPHRPEDVDMFGDSLGYFMDMFQGEAASQVTGLDDPMELAAWCLDIRYIADQFAELATAYERQFETEFGMVIEAD